MVLVANCPKTATKNLCLTTKKWFIYVFPHHFVARDKSQWMVVMDKFSSSEGVTHTIFNMLILNLQMFHHFMKQNDVKLESSKMDRFLQDWMT